MLLELNSGGDLGGGPGVCRGGCQRSQVAYASLAQDGICLCEVLPPTSHVLAAPGFAAPEELAVFKVGCRSWLLTPHIICRCKQPNRPLRFFCFHSLKSAPFEV